MNTVKTVWNAVKTDHKLQWMLAGMLLMLVSVFVIFFGKSIGLETNIKNVITNGLFGNSCLIFFFATEKSKYFYLFFCGFFSAMFFDSLGNLLEVGSRHF